MSKGKIVFPLASVYEQVCFGDLPSLTTPHVHFLAVRPAVESSGWRLWNVAGSSFLSGPPPQAGSVGFPSNQLTKQSTNQPTNQPTKQQAKKDKTAPKKQTVVQCWLLAGLTEGLLDTCTAGRPEKEPTLAMHWLGSLKLANHPASQWSPSPYGCGSKPCWHHFGVGVPPILVYFSGAIGMFIGGTVLTHGHIFQLALFLLLDDVPCGFGLALSSDTRQTWAMVNRSTLPNHAKLLGWPHLSVASLVESSFVCI